MIQLISEIRAEKTALLRAKQTLVEETGRVGVRFGLDSASTTVFIRRPPVLAMIVKELERLDAELDELNVKLDSCNEHLRQLV